MRDTSATLIYDGECSLCRTLAGFLSRGESSLQTMAWQEFRLSMLAQKYFDGRDLADTRAPRLSLIANDTIFVDTEAWQWLLQHQPEFKTLNWLAEKLNLQAVAANGLKRAGQFLRRRCMWCKPW